MLSYSLLFINNNLNRPEVFSGILTKSGQNKTKSGQNQIKHFTQTFVNRDQVFQYGCVKSKTGKKKITIEF